MSSIRETAEQFFDACETGKGWDGCQAYCHPGATFSAQVGALDGVETVRGLHGLDEGLHAAARRQLRGSLVRGRRGAEQRGRVRRVPRHAHRRGRAGAADGQASVEADYVYVMDFDGDESVT